MRYTIEKENQVKELAAQGKSSAYISSQTGIPEKVIWSWCPQTRPHDDVIKWSVKQRFHSVIPELEARISAAVSPVVKSSLTDDEWEDLNKVIYQTLFDEAIIVFRNLLEEPPEFGNEKRLSKEPFLEYVKNFWTMDSDYVKIKDLKPSYVEQCRNSVHYWSMLKKEPLFEVNSGDIERVYEKLTEKGLSQSRMNAIMKVGLIPLKYAYKNGLILNRSYEFCLPNPDKCHSASDDLAVKIFNTEWEDEEAFVANLVAYKCKMQLQEVRALRLKDIGFQHNICSHIYSDKLEENPRKRIVESSSYVRDVILRYASTSPYPIEPNNFVFFSESQNKPAHGKNWSLELKKVCDKLGIEEKVNFKMWSR